MPNDHEMRTRCHRLGNSRPYRTLSQPERDPHAGTRVRHNAWKKFMKYKRRQSTSRRKYMEKSRRADHFRHTRLRLSHTHKEFARIYIKLIRPASAHSDPLQNWEWEFVQGLSNNRRDKTRNASPDEFTAPLASPSLFNLKIVEIGVNGKHKLRECSFLSLLPSSSIVSRSPNYIVVVNPSPSCSTTLAFRSQVDIDCHSVVFPYA
jgi:hypothetical protein